MPTVLADAEALAVSWAKDDPDINAIVQGRVATNLPASPTFPFLTVFRIGGRTDAVQYLSDRAYLQWDCYASAGANKPDLRTASLLARTLVSKANNFQGLITPAAGEAGVVMGFEIITGPRRVPELDSDWGRFLVETFMYTLPYVG